MLLEAREHRYLLVAVSGLHLLLGNWLIAGQVPPETTAEQQITVSLIDAPAPARPEVPHALSTKAAAPARNASTLPAQQSTPMPNPQKSALTASSTTPDSAPSANSEARPSSPQASTDPRSETFAQARFDADYLQNPAPNYPPLSRRMHEEGKVVLRVSVTHQGSAESIEIKTSSGSDRLDQAALKTVRQWKFVPARRGDAAVQSWVLVPVQFKLEQ